MQLLLASRECCEKALSASIRRRRTQQDTPERRADRAQTMVLMGEVSAGRRVLEGAPLAPGTEATLRKLRQRPPAPRTPIVAEFSRQPDSLFLLDHQEFLKNLKTSRRGAAPGPSGMTAEHVKPLLENDNDAESLCQVAELLCRGHIPSEVLSVIRMGRLTALQKPTEGVRGIVAGDILRRLVSRTVAQQIKQQVERATAPFQYALSTRAGCGMHSSCSSGPHRSRSTVHCPLSGWNRGV